MINSRKLEDLSPIVHAKAIAFIEACRQQQIDVLITSTYRDFESQDALYAVGRTVPGKRVTNAKGGQSFHNFQIAFDFVPIVNGKAIWNNTNLWIKCGKIAESVGLEWGGSWRQFTDRPHCQYTASHPLAYFQNGGKL